MFAAPTRDASQIKAADLLVNAGFQRLEAFLESKVTMLLRVGKLLGSEAGSTKDKWKEGVEICLLNVKMHVCSDTRGLFLTLRPTELQNDTKIVEWLLFLN